MKKKENDCFVKILSRHSIAPFVWKVNCLFCGEKCNLQKDKKQHPDRWKESYACTTSDRGPNMLTYKDHLLKVSD